MVHKAKRWSATQSDKQTFKFARRVASSIFGLCTSISDKEKTEGERLFSHLSGADVPRLLDFIADVQTRLTRESPCEGRYSRTACDDFYRLAQVSSLFKKGDFFDAGIDKEAVAFDTWIDSESLCKDTNQRIQNYLFCLKDEESLRLRESLISRAQRKIAKVLGPVPDWDHLRLRLGPGSTRLTTKRHATPFSKFREPYLTCSKDLAPIVAKLLEEMPHLSSVYADSEDGERYLVNVTIEPDKLVFVPKSFKTHRAITQTCLLNSLIQNAIGDYMAERLLKAGQDITNQKRNQALAQLGSKYGDLATIDLSSASDTISEGLVALLLPIDWYMLLSSCISTDVEYNGKTIKQEKFCSMGNGFTFPLETLLFWAISTSHDNCFGNQEGHALRRFRGASVYGDDIIIDVRDFETVCENLKVFGFKPNISKSYSSGPFRESCGADFYNGTSVRPFFLKKRLSQAELYKFRNYIVRNHLQEIVGDSVIDLIDLSIDKSMVLYGPDGYGDGHLIPLHESERKLLFKKWWSSYCSTIAKHDGFAGWFFETYVYKYKTYRRTLCAGDSVSVLYDADFIVPGSDSPKSSMGDILLQNRVQLHEKLIKVYTLAPYNGASSSSVSRMI